MDASVVGIYVERLGLKPAQLGALMADPDVDRPYRVATVERGACGLVGFADDGALLELSAPPGDEPLAVGDFVVLGAGGRVARVLERVSVLERGSAHREGEAQLIAANLDEIQKTHHPVVQYQKA